MKTCTTRWTIAETFWLLVRREGCGPTAPEFTPSSVHLLADDLRQVASCRSAGLGLPAVRDSRDGGAAVDGGGCGGANELAFLPPERRPSGDVH